MWIGVEVSGSAVGLEQRILDCNPFLEAFGNAKTSRNDNSSRFGKFVKILYRNGGIVGARVEDFLLEKARITLQENGDRNFHIFYCLLAGATPEERQALHLQDISEYVCLSGFARGLLLVLYTSDLMEGDVSGSDCGCLLRLVLQVQDIV